MVKKISFIIIIVLFIITIFKYYISDYEIEYNIDSYEIKESYNGNTITFDIETDNYFQIILYQKRNMKKKLINKIEKIEKDNIICYNVLIDEEENITCFEDEKSVAYYLIENAEIKKYLQNKNLSLFENKKEEDDFKFYSNLDKNTYIALYNYKGFYIMNGEEIYTLDLLEREKYDNPLTIIKDEFLVLPNYDLDHEFKELYKVNIINKEVTNIKTPNIDFDSYWSGEYKNNLYLFDNKYSYLYEVNIKNNKIKEIGNEKNGYIKIKNNKKVNANKDEYTNKLTYFKKEDSNYEISDNLYKVYNEKYKVKIFNSNDVQIIKEYKDELYFINEDNLYIYNSEGLKKILHFFEFNFNKNNMLYIYIDN